VTRDELVELLELERYAPGPTPARIAPVRVVGPGPSTGVPAVPLLPLEDPVVLEHRRALLDELDTPTRRERSA